MACHNPIIMGGGSIADLPEHHRIAAMQWMRCGPVLPPELPNLSPAQIKARYLIPGTNFFGSHDFVDKTNTIRRYYNQDILESLARRAIESEVPQDGQWHTLRDAFDVFKVVKKRTVTDEVNSGWWISTPHTLLLDGTFEAKATRVGQWRIIPGNAKEREAEVTLRKISTKIILTDEIDANAWNEQVHNWKSNPVKKTVESGADFVLDKHLQAGFKLRVLMDVKQDEEVVIRFTEKQKIK